jgi:metal transporter CNNM
LTYGLFPVALPIAKLLDLLLGLNHVMVFNRLGLKTIILLHERLHHSIRERLTTKEIAIMSSVLDLNDTPISTIMTPISSVFTLSSDTFLNDMTRYNILKSGYSGIPIHLCAQPNALWGYCL